MPSLFNSTNFIVCHTRHTRIEKQLLHSRQQKQGLITLIGLLGLVGFAFSVYGMDVPAQDTKMDMATMDTNELEVAHPFFSHMGMPDAVGVYSLRLGGLVSRVDDKTNPDFAFHFETGLTKFIGVHIRNNGILNEQHTELMFQFAAVRSNDDMSGFAPIIEFEFPTHSGGDQHINTLVGFSTALANSKFAFNQVLHFDPRTETIEGSLAGVLKLGTLFYPVIEISGEGASGEQTMINVLGGLKVRVNKLLILGLAIQAPVTERKDFSWQLVFQPEIEFGTMKN